MDAKQNPLALAHTLRDLAVLRASDVELGGLVPGAVPITSTSESQQRDKQLDAAVAAAAAFVRAGRETLRTTSGGAVEAEGARLEAARAALDEVVGGLDASDGTAREQ